MKQQVTNKSSRPHGCPRTRLRVAPQVPSSEMSPICTEIIFNHCSGHSCPCDQFVDYDKWASEMYRQYLIIINADNEKKT